MNRRFPIKTIRCVYSVSNSSELVVDKIHFQIRFYFTFVSKCVLYPLGPTKAVGVGEAGEASASPLFQSNVVAYLGLTLVLFVQ